MLAPRTLHLKRVAAHLPSPWSVQQPSPAVKVPGTEGPVGRASAAGEGTSGRAEETRVVR